jgi:hypothetical protein
MSTAPQLAAPLSRSAAIRGATKSATLAAPSSCGAEFRRHLPLPGAQLSGAISKETILSAPVTLNTNSRVAKLSPSRFPDDFATRQRHLQSSAIFKPSNHLEQFTAKKYLIHLDIHSGRSVAVLC